MKHPSHRDLEEQWLALPASPKHEGEVTLLVTRSSAADMPKGQDKKISPLHKQPECIVFSPEDGVHGDRWKPGKDIGSQVSLVSLAVVRLVAGSKDRWHLLGDNLVVDMDVASLRIGTRLCLGTGELEISETPHEPCDRFEARLGKGAHSWVADPKHAERFLRGRYAKVIRGGSVKIGQHLCVVRR